MKFVRDRMPLGVWCTDGDLTNGPHGSYDPLWLHGFILMCFDLFTSVSFQKVSYGYIRGASCILETASVLEKS